MNEKIIRDKTEIKRIIQNKIKNKKLIFTNYYKFGIDKKGISHEKVLKIFPRFEKVFVIEIEKLRFGDIGFELFYKLSQNATFSIATCPKNKNLLIIHAIEYKRNLEKRFKKK